MVRLPNSVELAGQLLAEGRFAEFGEKLRGLVVESSRSFGLRRDLRVPLTPPKAKIPIAVRPYQESDRPSLLPEPGDIADRKERVELATRRGHADANIPQCYVAVDQRNGEPCYFQWLMDHKQNDRIQSLFGNGWFPILKRDEALLENAYTPVHYRGNGIMSEAMALIAERAGDLGCRYVMTFVGENNIASLKGCQKAGFAPHLIRDEQKLFFHLLRKTSFRLIDDSNGISGPNLQAAT